MLPYMVLTISCFCMPTLNMSSKLLLKPYNSMSGEFPACVIALRF